MNTELTDDQIFQCERDAAMCASGAEQLTLMTVRTAIAADRAQRQAGQDEPLTCDYCGADTFDPWHGSTADNKHLHACENCLHLLPGHQRQAGQECTGTDCYWQGPPEACDSVGRCPKCPGFAPDVQHQTEP